MERCSGFSRRSLSAVLAAVVSAAVTSLTCTKYTVAPTDGGDGHTASGGSAGVTAGTGGAGGGGPNLDASAGIGGAGAGMGVDASTKDAPRDLPLDNGAPLLANGSSCQTGAACQSGKCVDSFCCDSDCTGQCQSCRESSSPGKCLTIIGAVRGQIRPTCTGSGTCGATCNGTDPAQCHFPGSEKTCAPATCIAGVAKGAASCDGAGNCPSGATTNCDPFICGPTACKTTCTTSADCNASSYCAPPSCVAKKGLGAVCAVGEQCATGICGGRCCNTSCTCAQPSAGNLFTNAGFDSDLSDWGNTTGVQWSSQDADGCPYSGSVQSLFGSGNPRRCVSITPGAFYSIGGMFRNTDGNLWTCEWDTFAAANCTGTAGPNGMFSGSNTAWQISIASFQAPAGSQASVFFSCDSNGNTFMDKMFLTTGSGF